MEDFKTFVLYFTASIVTLLLCVTLDTTLDTNTYIKRNIVDKAELDSILDVRLGSGCDLYVDSCDACPY